MDIIRKQVGSTKKIVRVGKTKRRKQVRFPNFAYFNTKTKKKIKETTQIDRIKSLRIPPAYRNVSIAKNPNSKVQAMGEDDKGRKQYIYSQKHVKRQTNVKFHELIAFGKQVNKIRSDVAKNLNKAGKSNDMIFSKEILISLIIYLIDICNFRIGSDKYKRLYNSYGVTTLNNTHIKLEKGSMFIEFIGKKSVLNRAQIKDKKVCDLLNKICKKNNKEFLFESRLDDGNRVRITERHVNLYLKKYDPKIKVKMFRTWNANSILLDEILSYPIPANKSEAERNIKTIIESAAEKLHHTKSVSKSSYMNNKLLDLYTNKLDTFKEVCKTIKTKYGGKLPDLHQILVELFIYLDTKK